MAHEKIPAYEADPARSGTSETPAEDQDLRKGGAPSAAPGTSPSAEASREHAEAQPSAEEDASATSPDAARRPEAEGRADNSEPRTDGPPNEPEGARGEHHAEAGVDAAGARALGDSGAARARGALGDSSAPRARGAGPSAVPSAPPAEPREIFPLVGIGASAGGLSALKALFAGVPPDSGIAWVIVVHLAPTFESHLDKLLQPHVRMPVQQVTDTTPLEPNHVYVIPPNANLDTIDTHLRLTQLEADRRARAPIDHFFRTLARTHNGAAIGIVLTGTGSDGALGLKAIKEQGGLALVQNPEEAEYDGMPRSAIATGVVDAILTLDQMPEAARRFAETKPDLCGAEDEEEDLDREDVQLLLKVFAQVRARTGRDFTQYKRSTVLRRITRRMQLRGFEALGRYLEVLRQDPEEVRILADELLVTVTSFFRDREVFQALEEVYIPALFGAKEDGDEVRAWTVGCATGEEAYSLAMLLLEAGQRVDKSLSIQVFATDLHERSIQSGRDGFYPGDIEADVGAERLKRWFTKESGGYRIKNEVREVVLFAPHNVLADPPFSRVDLVSCRNLFIYLLRELQQEVTDLFHYALNPEGLLLLGTSESLERPGLFRTEDKRLSIFRRRNVPPPEPKLPVFPLTRRPARGSEDRRAPRPEPIPYGKLHLRLVEQYAPPSALVGPDDQVVHLSPKVGRFLLHPGGEPTSNILMLVRQELRVELRSVLSLARQDRRMVRSRPVRVQMNGATARVTLDVRPALDPDHESFCLVVFEENGPEEQQAEKEGLPQGRVSAAGDVLDRTREAEVDRDLARQRLQAIVEEYETTQEELRAANEELQSSNEELRSTLEELETSKEELQSMNEELQTVNQENRHRVEELSQISADLQNLLSATHIATLFLDKEHRLLRFTPKAAELFNVRIIDRGRPIDEVTHRLRHETLAKDISRVVGDLIPVEREVFDTSGRVYLARIRPYRSAQDQILGVVLTFIEITERVRAEQALRRSEARYRTLFESIDEGFGLLEAVAEGGDVIDFRWVEANPAFELHTGRREVVGRRLREIFPEDADRWIDVCRRTLESGERSRLEQPIGATGRHLDLFVFSVEADDVRRVAAIFRDISARKASEADLAAADRDKEARLHQQRRLIESFAELRLDRDVTTERVLEAIANYVREAIGAHQAAATLTTKLNGSEALAAVSLSEELGIPPEGYRGPRVSEALIELLRARRKPVRLKAAELNEKTAWVDASAEGLEVRGWLGAPLLGADGRYLGLLQLTDRYQGDFTEEDELNLLQVAQLASGILDNVRLFREAEREIGERRRAEQRLVESEKRLRSLAEASPSITVMLDAEGKPAHASRRWQEYFGISFQEAGARGWVGTIHPDDFEGVVERWRAVVAAGAVFESEHRAIRHDGEARWHLARIVPIVEDAEGARASRPIGFCGTLTDIHDLKEAERRKDEFLAMLGHELRNPLAAIRSASELIHLLEAEDERLERARSVLDRQVIHMARLVDGLLEVSRISRGKIDLDRTTVDLRQILELLLEDRSDAVAAQDLTLQVELDEQPLWVLADRVRLAQIFDNLLSNAMKFTKPGGTITCSAHSEEGYVTARVRDTGVGIPADMLDRIFEPFQQAGQDLARRAGGLGLGLALVKGLVELHGGRVEAKSEGLGKGTEVIVRLPHGVAPDPGPTETRDEAQVTAARRILLVEDNLDAAEMLQALLVSRGHEVTWIGDGRDALETLRASRFEVVLCDLGLPSMSGYELARAVRRDPELRATPLVALTGYGRFEDRERSLAAGFDAHLTKPVDLGALEGLLSRLPEPK